LDDSLDSKKHLSQKNGLLGWRSGLGKLSHKGKKCPHYDVTQRTPHTQNEKKFFSFELKDLLNP